MKIKQESLSLEILRPLVWTLIQAAIPRSHLVQISDLLKLKVHSKGLGSHSAKIYLRLQRKKNL